MADLVSDFVRLLALGLKLNKSFMDPSNDQLVLHEELEKGYDRFEQLLNSCSIFATKKDRYAGEDSSLSLSSSSNTPDTVARTSTKKNIGANALSGSGSDSPARSATRKAVASVTAAAELPAVPSPGDSSSPRSPRSDAKLPKPLGSFEKTKSTKLSKERE